MQGRPRVPPLGVLELERVEVYLVSVIIILVVEGEDDSQGQATC